MCWLDKNSVEQIKKLRDKFNISTFIETGTFKGVNAKSFDGRGNYSLGVKEQLIFPETDYEKIDRVRGMDITFVTSAKNNQKARELLESLGMPFKKEEV